MAKRVHLERRQLREFLGGRSVSDEPEYYDATRAGTRPEPEPYQRVTIAEMIKPKPRRIRDALLTVKSKLRFKR